MLITHCNIKQKHCDVWHLHNSKELYNRKIYLFNCRICNKKIALLEQFSRKDNKCYQTSYIGFDADKLLNKSVRSLFYKESEWKAIKPKINTYKWVYGINTNVYDKSTGKLIGTKSYAADFYGNKIEV